MKKLGFILMAAIVFVVGVFALACTPAPVDYGALTIANVENLMEGQSSALSVEFEKPEYESKITYEYDEEVIYIKNGTVTALKGGQTVTVTAKTEHHETTFTVSTLVDYGALNISNVMNLTEGKSAPLDVRFSKPTHASEITYSYDASVISIENGMVTALKGGQTVTVTATTAHHSTTFTVITLVDYGTLSIQNVVGLKEGQTQALEIEFSKSEHASEITYTYDASVISIENGNVTALKGGQSIIVNAKTEHHSAIFMVSTLVDYGTLSIGNVENLTEGKSALLNVVFSKSEHASAITYTYDTSIIKIENGYVTALKGGQTVTVTAKTSKHKATFTVSTLVDYGTLKISDVTNLPQGESEKLSISFSIPKHSYAITYTYDEEIISIENGYVTAFVGERSTVVTAKTLYHETTFTVTTVIDYGEIEIEPVTAWVGYPAVDVYASFTKPEYAEEVVYTCNQSGITIDGNKISVSSSGVFTVTATTSHITKVFSVTANTVDTNHTWYVENERFTYKADTRLKKWQSEGIDNSTTIYIGDSFFDYSECWPDFEETHYRGKDAMCIGISGSKTYHWETWANGWLSQTAPKNVVMHIGTNNISAGDTAEGTFDSLKRMFTIMHHNLPDTHFYWFSITHHASTSASYSNNYRRDDVNKLMKKWCEERDYMTYVHTVDSISGDMLHDGVHPSVQYYKIFVDAVANAGLKVNDLPASRKGLEVINQGYDNISYDATTKTVTGGIEYVAPYRGAGFVRKDGVFYEGNFSVSGTATYKASNKIHLEGKNYWIGLFVSSTYHDIWYGANKALPFGVMAFKGNVTQTRGYYADNNTTMGSFGSISGESFDYQIIAYEGTVIIGVNGVYKTITDKNAFSKTYFGINAENCTYSITMDFVTDENTVKADCEEILKEIGSYVPSSEIEDIEFAKTDEIGKNGKKFVLYREKDLTDNYIISGKVDVYDSDKSKPNKQGPHLHIGFGTSTQDRILLYDRSLTGKYELGIPNAYPTDGSDTFTKPNGGTLTIEWKIMKVNGNAFFYLDGELRAVYTGMSKTNGLLLGSEWNDSKFYDMKAISLQFDSGEYNAEIVKHSSLINQYSSVTANTKTRV